MLPQEALGSAVRWGHFIMATTGVQLQQIVNDLEKAYSSARDESRKAAPLFMLAIFAAIATLLVQPFPATSAIPYRPSLIFVAFLGNLSLFLLWYQDNRVFLKLLHSAFVLGVYVERKFPDAVPIRHYIFKNNGDLTKTQGYFYYLPSLLLVLVQAAALAVSTEKYQLWTDFDKFSDLLKLFVRGVLLTLFLISTSLVIAMTKAIFCNRDIINFARSLDQGFANEFVGKPQREYFSRHVVDWLGRQKVHAEAGAHPEPKAVETKP